jgi:hypothetical protein
MTGERLAWFRVASHLCIPVEELAERITHREFVSWLEYLNQEDTVVSKEDFYLAQIAAEVRRSFDKYPNKVKTKSFLLSPAEKKTAATDSKSIWLAALNIKPEKN